MSNSFIKIAITIMAVIVVRPSYSQQKKDTVKLNEVVVTGSPVKVNLNNIPMAVSVVTRKEIEESDESALLPVLSGRVPGLFVTERGVTGFGVSTGAAGQITMRGIGGSPTTGVLMLIDGHPQFMGIFGHPLSDSYISSDVERVEVIRGPASILYGTNAMGGVINIITRQQNQNGFHGNARIMYGSYNTQKYMAAGGFKKDKFTVFASVNRDQTDGHRPNSDFKITNGYIKMGYQIDNHFSANTDFSLAKFKTQDPGPDTTNAIPGSSLNITRGYWAMTVDNDFEEVSGSVKLFYNFGDHKISDGFHSTDENYGANIFESVKLFKGNNITLGADYIKYGGKAETGNVMTFIDTTIYEAGIYGFVQQNLFNRLTLNAGLRLQHHEVYGNIWIPSAGFALKISKATTWKTSASKGFRSPTLQELFMWNHNPKLNPEKAYSYETGILQSFFNHKLDFELTGFYVKSNNQIISVPLKGLQNAGKVSNKGIELSADLQPVENVKFNVSYSYIDMKTPVYATPKHQLFISDNYRINKFQLTASMKYVDHLNTDPESVHFSTYTLVDAKVAYQAWKFAGLYFSCENLLNQKYETNRYYPMPKTTFFGGVNFKF